MSPSKSFTHLNPRQEAAQLVSDFLKIVKDFELAQNCARFYVNRQPFYCVAHEVFWKEMLAQISLLEPPQK